MTKRDFDRETKAVHRYMASDERCSYRETRCLPHRGSGSHYPTETRDRVAERAARMRQLRGWRYSWEGEIAALGRGSPYRAPAVYRARAGKSLLE